MNSEQARFESFKYWPVTHKSPSELAKDGFYYIQDQDVCGNMVADIVRCNFCFQALGHWEETDSIREEHKKHSPICPFINGQATNNVPIKEENIQFGEDSEFMIFRIKKTVFEKAILDNLISEIFAESRNSFGQNELD